MSFSTLTWSLAHPAGALVAKAVAEEALEATVTGTAFDPDHPADIVRGKQDVDGNAVMRNDHAFFVLY